MWSEQVEGEAIQGKLWPRGAALAERLWSDLPTGGLFYDYYYYFNCALQN
jgi:hypothetical protein